MTYNGIDPRELHPCISIAKEIPPGAPGSQLEYIRGGNGEIIGGRTMKASEYRVTINISAKTREAAREIRAMIAAWACPMDTQTHQLCPTHWPAMAYDAVLKEITQPEFSFGFATVDVIFSIPRPIAYSTILRRASASSEDGGGVNMHLSILGTSYARPELAITAKDAVRVEVLAEGKMLFAIGKGFAAGDVIRMRTDVPGVTISRASGTTERGEQMLDYASTDLDAFARAMKPGRRSISCAQASSITATWRDEYL